MAKTFTVTSAELTKKANDLRAKNRTLKTKIDDLKSHERALNSQWDGEANDAFHKAFTTDIVKMENFNQTIENYAKSLENIAKQYENAEKRNLATATQRK